ncbi:hypothetical protein EEO77_22070 [Salmonella enterica]|nr:hypothetical protein [Salmonella enterica]
MPEPLAAPHWHPLSMLPIITRSIEGEFESLEELFSSLLAAREKPYVLTNDCIERTVHLCHNQAELLPVTREQLRRWHRESPTPAQQAELLRLEDIIAHHEALIPRVLALANELESATIDALLSMDEGALGMAVLEGHIKPPPGAPHSEALRLRELHATAELLDTLAREIDTDVTPLEFLMDVAEQLPLFYRMMEISTDDEINQLCEQRPGLYRFAKALEQVAEGIRSGAIKVPPV